MNSDKLNFLMQVIAVLREINPQFKAQTIQTFLYIAANQGCDMADIQRDLKLTQASTSRNVAILSHVKAKNEPGLGFIRKVIAIDDPKKYRLYLTAKGQKFLNTLTNNHET